MLIILHYVVNCVFNVPVGYVSARCPHSNGVYDNTRLYTDNCDPSGGLHNNHAHLSCACKEGTTLTWIGNYTQRCI